MSIPNGFLLGSTLTVLEDVDGDGYDELVVGSAERDNAVYVWFLHAGNATVRAATKIGTASPGLSDIAFEDAFGSNPGSISSIGDLDGDGISELAVGTMWDDDGAYRAGAVYILFLNAGNATVRSSTKISATTGGLSEANVTLAANDKFGASLTATSDLDGDGIREIAVGTLKERVFILFLNAGNGTVRYAYELNNATIPPVALEPGDVFGQGIASLPVSGEFDRLVCGIYARDSFAGGVVVMELNGTFPPPPVAAPRPTPPARGPNVDLAVALAVPLGIVAAVLALSVCVRSAARSA